MFASLATTCVEVSSIDGLTCGPYLTLHKHPGAHFIQKGQELTQKLSYNVIGQLYEIQVVKQWILCHQEKSNRRTKARFNALILFEILQVLSQ